MTRSALIGGMKSCNFLMVKTLSAEGPAGGTGSGFGGWDIKMEYIIDVCCSWRKRKEIMLLGGWVASRKVASTSFCGGGEKAERNNEEKKRKERAL